MTVITIEQQTRAEVAKFLPRAISKALLSYHEFMEAMSCETDTKEFSDVHKAAKVAISHIELLIKLAKWADLPDADIESEGERNELWDLINKASRDVEAYHGRESDES